MKHGITILIVFMYTLGFSIEKIPETPFTEYRFNAAECKLIQHHQSRIFIPPFAFFQDGKLYQGDVVLKYREFVDQLDLILNNIPMAYQENGKQHVLESAGMFEFLAYGNGKLLSFAPAKKAQVQLATAFNMTGGETFILNRQTNTWRKDIPFASLSESNREIGDDPNALWPENVWNDAVNNDEIFDSSGNTNVAMSSSNSNTLSFETLSNQAFKTLNVDKMEVYNCDKILTEETIPILADFNLQGFKQALHSPVYVVYKNRNAVLTYFPEQFKSDFKLIANEDFTIFTFSMDGKIAVLDNAFAANFDAKNYRNKTVLFPLKVFAKAPNTKEELAKITGL